MIIWSAKARAFLSCQRALNDRWKLWKRRHWCKRKFQISNKSLILRLIRQVMLRSRTGPMALHSIETSEDTKHNRCKQPLQILSSRLLAITSSKSSRWRVRQKICRCASQARCCPLLSHAIRTRSTKLMLVTMQGQVMKLLPPTAVFPSLRFLGLSTSRTSWVHKIMSMTQKAAQHMVLTKVVSTSMSARRRTL